jgi:hypothetical protein
MFNKLDLGVGAGLENLFPFTPTHPRPCPLREDRKPTTAEAKYNKRRKERNLITRKSRRKNR